MAEKKLTREKKLLLNFINTYKGPLHPTGMIPAAKALGVSRQHLYQVLNSQKEIPDRIAIKIQRLTKGMIKANHLNNNIPPIRL